MQNVLRLLVLGLPVLGLLVLRLLVLVLGLLVVRLLVLVVSCCWHCLKELLSAEPGSSNTDMIDDEDAAEKPYNDLRVIRRALTAATQTDQMEAAWGHDPRWQVCMLCSSPSPFCPPCSAFPPFPPPPCACIQFQLLCGMVPTSANNAIHTCFA